MVQTYYVEPEYWIEGYAEHDPISAAAQVDVVSSVSDVTGTFLFTSSATVSATSVTSVHALRQQIAGMVASIASSTYAFARIVPLINFAVNIAASPIATVERIRRGAANVLPASSASASAVRIRLLNAAASASALMSTYATSILSAVVAVSATVSPAIVGVKVRLVNGVSSAAAATALVVKRIQHSGLGIASSVVTAANIGVTRSARQVISVSSDVVAHGLRVISRGVSTIAAFATSVFSAREKWEPTQSTSEDWADQSVSANTWAEQQPTDENWS